MAGAAIVITPVTSSMVAELNPLFTLSEAKSNVEPVPLIVAFWLPKKVTATFAEVFISNVPLLVRFPAVVEEAFPPIANV